MRNLVESLAKDAMERFKQPEVQSAIHANLLAPLISSILEFLTPYLAVVVGVWSLMIVLLVVIIILLLRKTGIQ